MAKSKLTKKALLTSALSIVLCLAMLMGTTFAWFTDSAATAVNTIQAGTLDIQLLDAEGNSVEGETLNWKTADGRPQDQILWEPGCTYELQPVTIRNNGNLALKYKIAITGIGGDAELNQVINWTIQVNGVEEDLTTYEGKLAAGGTAALTIKGHMEETAGNQYQGKSIKDVSITVVATQDTVEYDSNNNIYDANAAYPVTTSEVFIEKITGGSAIVLGNDIDLAGTNYLVLENDATVDLNGNELTSAYEIDLLKANITFADGTYTQPEGSMEGNSNPTALMLWVGSATLSNVNFTAADHAPATPIPGVSYKQAIALFPDEGENVTVTIEDGTVVNGDIDVFAPMSDINEDGEFGFGKSTLIIKGGTFNFAYGTGLTVHKTSSTWNPETQTQGTVTVPEGYITVQISGGTFKGLTGTKEVLEEYLVAGFRLQEDIVDGDTWYTVVPEA